MSDKEYKHKESLPFIKIKEEDLEQDKDGKYYFYLATTLPDRVSGKNYHGQEYVGEILSKNALDNIASLVNDESKMGGKHGSYRTIGLFHDRVYERNPSKEEAGFIVGSATVEPLKEHPGHFGVKVPVEVNQYYTPSGNYVDYTADKITYKIDKGVIGLSIEYDNTKDQETLVEIGGENYNYIKEITDFRGSSFARANVIGNPTAVRIKEIGEFLMRGNSKKEGDITMEDNTKIKEQLEEQSAKLKEVTKQLEALSKTDAKFKELEDSKLALEAKIKEMELKADELAAKIKEGIEKSFDTAFKNIAIQMPAKTKEGDDEEGSDEQEAKVKEVLQSFESAKVKELGATKVKEFDWSVYTEHAVSKIKEQEEYFKNKLLGDGIRFDTNKTLKLKCVGRTVVVEPTAKTKEVLTKTKDTIDTNQMEQTSYYQTNAFFADRYTPGITETFLKSDSLLKAMLKVPHTGGNDKYQWKIWVDFGTFTGTNTAAVDPNITSVTRTKREFIKLETPIREYRDGVEITDFTQYHAQSVVNLMDEEIMRAAEFVTNSMNADLFKGYADGTTGWKGFNGLLYIADSSTYTSLYGRTRSAANRLLDSTTANTYVTTAEDFTLAVARSMYEKVLGQGSTLSEIAFVGHPTQARLLFDREGAQLRNNQISMAGAPPEFGFSRAMIPYIDGIPFIRDYYCTDASGNADTVAVVDLGKDGFVLVTSKPLDVRGLAKVGTSESAYVSFWGQAVYKRPRNICLHDDLTTS